MTFASGEILTAADLNRELGYEGWEPYTPTWTNLTVGNGTILARFAKRGRTVDVYLELTFGTTTAPTGSSWYFTLPPGDRPASHYGVRSFLGTAVMLDASANANSTTGIVDASGSNGRIWVGASSAPGVASPFTWAVNDRLMAQLRYETN